MYRVYKRKDGTVESLAYRKTYNQSVEIAIGGDFRKGYITFSNLEFETLYGNSYHDFKTRNDMNIFLENIKKGIYKL